MVQSNPMLTRRACVLAKIESIIGTDAAPTAASDAILVASPDFSVDLTTLQRNYVRSDLSPIGVSVGRKLAKMKFTCEVRSNGRTNSGSTADASKLGRLLRACGYSEAGVDATHTVGPVLPEDPTVAVLPTWVSTGNNGTSNYFRFQITCVKGGASGTAMLRVADLNGLGTANPRSESINISAASVAGTVAVDNTDPTVPVITFGGTFVVGERVNFNVLGFPGTFQVTGTTPTAVATQFKTILNAINADFGADDDTGVVTLTLANAFAGDEITSGTTTVSLAGSSVTLVPTWTGNLALGQSWTVDVSPKGIRYLPISDNFETITLYLYMDGILHKMVGCMGTLSLKTNAGQFGTIDFEFTGQYTDPIDAGMPANPSYEVSKPPQFELAKLRVDSEDVTIDSLSFTQNNTITPRSDANSPDGYAGVRLTGRNPQGGIDPEATKTGDYNFFQKLAAAATMPMQCRFGKVDGNVIWLRAPKVQYSGLTYKDRDGITTYDAALQFTGNLGNDEIELFFA